MIDKYLNSWRIGQPSACDNRYHREDFREVLVNFPANRVQGNVLNVAASAIAIEVRTGRPLTRAKRA
jgi:hypothetical protein